MVAERIGWTIMFLLIVAAGAGLFGDGVFSRASANSPNELTVEYERFVRYLTPTVLQINVWAHSDAESIQIKINRDFLQGTKIEDVVPTPLSVVSGDNWLGYNFGVQSPGHVLIRFELTHDKAGSVKARISVGAGAPVSFQQFVYP